MGKTSKKAGLAGVFSLCAVMYSAYVGPGFASGTQTVSYFNNKGWIGVFIGPLIAGILCFVFNMLLFEINRIYQPKSYREAYNTIYRPKGLQLYFFSPCGEPGFCARLERFSELQSWPSALMSQ